MVRNSRDGFDLVILLLTIVLVGIGWTNMQNTKVSAQANSTMEKLLERSEQYAKELN